MIHWHQVFSHSDVIAVMHAHSLKDVESSEGRLYLVFEWLEKDLKKYMDSTRPLGEDKKPLDVGMDISLVKVRRCLPERSLRRAN